jgi:hypothetical protein
MPLPAGAHCDHNGGMRSKRTTLIALWTGCAAAIVTGALYQNFLDHLPAHGPGGRGELLEARVLAPIGYGFLIGTVLAWILRRLESTSSNLALVLAVACGVVGDLATFSFAHRDFVAAERSALEQDSSLDPSARSRRIADLEQSTVVDYVCAARGARVAAFRRHGLW